MKVFIVFLTLMLATEILFSQTTDSLTFSEVMFSADSTNCEFIEIYNYSKTQQYNLRGIKIRYDTRTRDSLIVISDSILKPNSYAIILEGDYPFSTNHYVFPENIPILITEDNNFGSSGMANSEDKIIKLISVNGDTISTYQYSANNNVGFSDEKYLMIHDNSTENWKNSSVWKGTPGKMNSISPLNYDLFLHSIFQLFQNPSLIDTLHFRIQIKNIGLENNHNSSLKCYFDENKDSLFSENEIFSILPFDELLFQDSTFLSIYFPLSDSGNHFFYFTIFDENDENLQNNSAFWGEQVSLKVAKFQDVVINEIMYLPITDEPEWLEIYNNSDFTINLKNWRIWDRSSSKIISDENLFLEKNKYLVIAKDNTIQDFYEIPSELLILEFPSLNNTDEELKITNENGTLIDTIYYESNWNTENFSLERKDSHIFLISQQNWLSCENTFRGTPGYINSATQKDFDVKIENFQIIDEFPFYNTEISFVANIVNSGKEEINGNLKLFIDNNFDLLPDTQIGEQLFILQSLETSEIQFNNSFVLQNEVNILLYAECELDQDTTNNKSFLRIFPSYPKSSVIINEVKFLTENDEPEWLEVQNISDFSINLKNWQISDLLNSPSLVGLSDSDLTISPNQLLVISDDSLIFDFYFHIPAQLKVIKIPNLNNSEDGIRLFDANNNLIDSVYFKDNWAKYGFSFEKINPTISDFDSTNWGISSDFETATPGRKNSLSQREFDAAIDTFFVSSNNLMINSQISFSAVITNLGKNPISLNLILSNNNATLYEQALTLSVDESKEINFTNIFQIQTETNFKLAILSNQDEDSTNNQQSITIFPSYPKSSVIINEVKFLTENDEPEWLEVQNISDFSINLKNWQISDLLNSPSLVGLSDSDLTISPNQLLVISDDSLIFDFYFHIPAQLKVIKIPNLNNSEDGIRLFDANNNLIDSVYFKDNWAKYGFSFEKINPTISDFDSTNWGISSDFETATPGKVNSLTQKVHDLGITNLQISPEFPNYNEFIELEVTIRNFGSSLTEQSELQISWQTASEQLFTTNAISQLNPSDSIIILVTSPLSLIDSLNILTKINYSLDEDTSQNYSQILLSPGIDKSSLLINEFYAISSSNETEWIEIYNNSNFSYPINWIFLADSSKRNSPQNLNSSKLFAPNSFMIFATDTSLFYEKYGKLTNVHQVDFGSLSNRRDIIYLFDYRGNLVDSVIYNSNLTPKKSIERIDSVNHPFYNYWLVCIDSIGATPNLKNSVNKCSPSQYNAIKINEIMYEPGNSSSEYVEIANISENKINIGGWKIKIGDETLSLSQFEYYLEPHNYFVIASDSSIFNNFDEIGPIYILNQDLSLSNNGERLRIYDAFTNSIDSINYSPNWHNSEFLSKQNISLEKINPKFESDIASNWSSSVNILGGTPGKQNSIFTDLPISSSQITINPNPFSPDNDGFEDYTIISYQLKNNLSKIRIRIFDSKGRLVRTIIENTIVGNDGNIVFDGKNDSNNFLKMGIYILLFEEIDGNNKLLNVYKKPFVVARKL